MEFPQYPLTAHSQEINRTQDEEMQNTFSSNSTTNSPNLEQMFEKVVTPSDVGKLNRLVIPKQHAERYFPVFPQDPSSSEKGSLLLNFEEIQSGKPWRFRYSYWNSSQSYVMTKGWSRFVKDKRLSAGDTVSFLRGYEGRLFIDWRRRVAVPEMPMMGSINVPCWGWGTPMYLRTMPQVRVEHGIMQSLPVAVPRSDMIEPVRRQVRLFGVNIDECNSEQEDPPSPLQWTLSLVTPSARNTEPQLMPRRTSSDDENNIY